MRYGLNITMHLPGREFPQELQFQLQVELRSLKDRVEILENLGTQLSHIEREMSPKLDDSVDAPESLVGFQTLKIIRDICDKEWF